MIRTYPPGDRTTIRWAGGTSTEMFIFPPETSFSARDFSFRISTATVEVEESDFTFFEGITRHLMILKGTLELTHVGRYTKHLHAYDQDTFSGEWKTRSKGKVTDFNLMLRNGYTGQVEHRHLEHGQTQVLKPNAAWNFLFVAAGSCRVNETAAVSGDLVQFSSDMQLTATGNLELVLVEVQDPA